MIIKRYRVRFLGRVQGVGFRAFVEDMARTYGLMGWVKNNADRSVSCEVQGEEARVERFLSEVQAGNGYSRVQQFYKTEDIVRPEETSFKIRY